MPIWLNIVIWCSIALPWEILSIKSISTFSAPICVFSLYSPASAEIRLQVEELESNMTVEESASIRLGCSIPSQSSRDSRFSVSWYVERPEGDDDDEEDEEQPGQEEKECVFSIGHDAVFGNGNCSPREEPGPNSRLQFERMTSDQYSLTIQGARSTDTGRYYCHVEEWLLNPRNAWYRLATNNSGFTIVNVIQRGKSRSISNLKASLNAAESEHCDTTVLGSMAVFQKDTGNWRAGSLFADGTRCH